ncbi:unnamed protein product [Dibothriocephalus latus]|uniref:Uncharacterized protein n=1 Tax=Dibothriocephalus latus TaxID=60516 RepID=A0A3P7LH58_DIBLA|nr:unnamed protein product [Dibothriocephalus latus]
MLDNGHSVYVKTVFRTLRYLEAADIRREKPGLRKKLAHVGCSSLTNRDKRFREKRDKTPGPDAYTIKSKWPGYEKDPCGLMLGKLMNMFICKEPSPIPCERKHEPPSIPIPKYAFGYEEGPHGDLVRQPGPDRDQTIGKRSDFGAANKNPGPGTYLDENNDPWVIMRRKALDRNNINSTRVLFVPRYADQVALRNERDNFPGPGYYDLTKSEDEGEADNDNHPPFNISADVSACGFADIL